MSYLDRLRPASFIAPDSVEFFFLIDSLERSGGKKGATQEILDSGESISQDQGNQTETFTAPIYFPGPDYDLDADPFYKALGQQYSQDTPGILKHPRWGDINVFPFTWSQSEELIDGSQISRIAVTFREVFPQIFPTTDDRSLDAALSDLDETEVVSEELSKGINVDSVQSQLNIAGKIRDAVGIITDSIKDITDLAADVQDQFNAIQATLFSLIDDVGGSIVQMIATTQRLIRTPGRIITQTQNKINGYKGMVSDLCRSFNDESETSPINRRNNVLMMQLIGGFAVGATAEAAAFTDFSIRSESIDAIESINEAADVFDDLFTQARTSGNVGEEFSGDYNFFNLILDAQKRINEILLNRAFDLKAEKRFILKNNSDAVTLTYEHYKTVDSDVMEFFILTNRLIGDEFIEIPAGREIVVYG